MSNIDNYPRESDKTIKAREKLQSRLNEIEKKITPDALNRKIIQIHDKIARQPDRVVLKTKITLFDNNSQPAETSKKINELSNQLKIDTEKAFSSLNNLSDTLKNHLITSERST